MPRWLGILLAPALWLERARGRRRKALVFLYLCVLVFGSVFIAREASLRGLPDVGEPFDTRAFENPRVADSDNAFVLYRQASAALGTMDDFDSLVWKNARSRGTATDVLRTRLESNRGALELWRQGTDRPDAINPFPQELHLRAFANLALFEAARLQEAGDLAGAWRWYRAVLRSSRHVGRHGREVDRFLGNQILQMASKPVADWLVKANGEAALLRTALDDLLACEAMTAPVSEAIKREYLELIRELDLPKEILEKQQGRAGSQNLDSVLNRFELFRKHEPERSMRVARLICANLLAACDLPPSEQPEQKTDLGLYVLGPDAPFAARAVGPERLVQWAMSSRVLTHTRAAQFLVNRFWKSLKLEQIVLAGLEIDAAERLYTLERGAPPANLGALLGRYLPKLPDGYTPDEPGPLPPEPADSQGP